MDERGKFLSDHIEFFERNINILQQDVIEFIKENKQNEIKINIISSRFETISAQEPYLPMRSVIKEMADTFNLLKEKTHELLCIRPDKIILSILLHIQTHVIIPFRRLLKDREIAIKTEIQFQKELDESFMSTKEKEKKKRTLQDQKRRVLNVNQLIEYHLKKLEEYRINKLKLIIQEIIYMKIYYHCQAIKGLSPINKITFDIQPENAVEEILQKIREYDQKP